MTKTLKVPHVMTETQKGNVLESAKILFKFNTVTAAVRFFIKMKE
jgi:hypothetical protein